MWKVYRQQDVSGFGPPSNALATCVQKQMLSRTKNVTADTTMKRCMCSMCRRLQHSGRLYCYLPNALAALDIIKSVCVSVSQWLSLSHKLSWTLYRSQSSTDLHQTCHQGRVPGDVVTYRFWWKSKIFLSAKQEVELILNIAPVESLMSNNLKHGARYDVGPNGGQIGNHQWAFDCHHYRWPWMTLNPRSSRSLQLQSNISITVYGMQQHWADTRSIERIFLVDKLFRLLKFVCWMPQLCRTSTEIVSVVIYA